jgi:energy-coupling factor transporter ATP-binding protein EcfA2
VRQAQHVAIYGQTGSGKSTLLRKLAALAHGIKRPVVVGTSASADPQAWSWADYVTTDGEQLAKVVAKCANSFVCIDEAWQILGNTGGKLSPLGEAILTMRHRGNTCAIAVQRPSLVTRTIRDQCGRLFCFRVGADDARDLVKQYGHAELAQASKLPRGSFLTCDPWEGVKHGKVF